MKKSICLKCQKAVNVEKSYKGFSHVEVKNLDGSLKGTICHACINKRSKKGF